MRGANRHQQYLRYQSFNIWDTLYLSKFLRYKNILISKLSLDIDVSSILGYADIEVFYLISKCKTPYIEIWYHTLNMSFFDVGTYHYRSLEFRYRRFFDIGSYQYLGKSFQYRPNYFPSRVLSGYTNIEVFHQCWCFIHSISKFNILSYIDAHFMTPGIGCQGPETGIFRYLVLDTRWRVLARFQMKGVCCPWIFRLKDRPKATSIMLLVHWCSQSSCAPKRIAY